MSMTVIFVSGDTDLQMMQQTDATNLIGLLAPDPSGGEHECNFHRLKDLFHAIHILQYNYGWYQEVRRGVE